MTSSVAEAEALGADMRVATATETLYARAEDAGHYDDDFAAVAEEVG